MNNPPNMSGFSFLYSLGARPTAPAQRRRGAGGDLRPVVGLRGHRGAARSLFGAEVPGHETAGEARAWGALVPSTRLATLDWRMAIRPPLSQPNRQPVFPGG